ncbi:NEMP family [Cinara cedri]|uniref:NEMP family n=1 Tax=Cinara cedri TaxID=506608 RepID=A0A5E4M3Y3_9HEMI|nr:NEMP family [Cinara cedri]
MTSKLNIICLIIIQIICLSMVTLTSAHVQPYTGKVYQVNADDAKICCSTEEKNQALPPIYCFPGSEKSLIYVFQTVTVDIIIGKTDDFTVYQSPDQHELENQILSDVATLSFNKIISYFWKRKYFKLDPFQPSCFSIVTNNDFEIRINSNTLDIKLLAMFLVGVLLFGYSARLSHNSAFYYLCGITIGVSASFIIVLFLIGRLIPKKKLMLGFVGGSLWLSLYVMQMLIENLNIILILYYKYILGYFGFSVLVSFVVCYRYGPVTNPRSKDLIRWTLQLIGLSLITLSSFHLEAMVFVDMLSVLFYYSKLSLPFRLLPKRKPKLQLLSEDEYIQQAIIETPKALEELKNYCNSPDCDTWKIISRLRDPKKFAKFMNTSEHISPDAVTEHENETDDNNIAENESDDSNEDDIKQIEYTSDSE